LTTFATSSIIFGGSFGSVENWLKPKTEPPSGNLACPNPWNTLCNFTYIFVSCIFNGKFESSIHNQPMEKLNPQPLDPGVVHKWYHSSKGRGRGLFDNKNTSLYDLKSSKWQMKPIHGQPLGFNSDICNIFSDGKLENWFWIVFLKSWTHFWHSQIREVDSSSVILITESLFWHQGISERFINFHTMYMLVYNPTRI